MELKDLDTLNDETFEKSGGEFFTAIIDDEHYFDRNIEKRKFEDGKIYYPSVTMVALKMIDSIDGISILYHNQEGKPRFTYYLNMSYLLSQITKEKSVSDHPIETVEKFNSYEDLPYWMSYDALVEAYERDKVKKEADLYALVDKQTLRLELERLVESTITTGFLAVQTVVILPMIFRSNIVMRTGYTVVIAAVLTRFIGRSIRLSHDYFKQLKIKSKK